MSAGYTFAQNPFPPGHKNNPRRLEDHDKWVYGILYHAMGGRMGDTGESGLESRVFSTPEQATAVVEAMQKTDGGACAYRVINIPIDFVAVDDS